MFEAFIHSTKSIFQEIVGDARQPVGGGSGILLAGIGTAGSSELTVVASVSSGSRSEPGSRNHPRCIPASRRMPISFFWEPPNLQCAHQYRSRNLHGARPKPVTQKSALRICESISTQTRRGELMSLQVGVHMAGAALQSSRKSIPPQATTLRPYTVIKNPGMVRNHFQKPFSPMTKDCVHGNLGGGMYPFAYCVQFRQHATHHRKATVTWQ